MADDALTAGAVARQLGVAVTTLRTWHQRYGLGPSHHVPGQHRRYTPEDMDRLQVMRRLTAQGVSPAEAAAWARRVPVPLPESSPPGLGLLGVQEPDAGSAGAPGRASGSSGPPGYDRGLDSSGSSDGARGRAHSRDGGGNAIAVGRAGPAARGLARAAMRLDAPALRDLLELTIADQGVIGTWEDVIMPVLVGIGERYETTRKLIEVEHLLSRTITEVLASVARPPSRRPTQVLLTAADEEQHTLPLEALAAALAEAGVPTRLLGARVPPEALAGAIARTGPSAVVVWSQLPGTANPAQLTRILTDRHRPVLVAAAGPGWTKDDLPPGATLLSSLPEAVATLSAAAGQH